MQSPRQYIVLAAAITRISGPIEGSGTLNKVCETNAMQDRRRTENNGETLIRSFMFSGRSLESANPGMKKTRKIRPQ
jgi:hypothetical protein